MKVLLTGAAGCIGSALCDELRAHGHELFALVRTEAAPALGDGVTLIAADLTRPLATCELPECIDAVMHYAQCRRYREFPAAVSEVFAINTAAALALMQYAVGAGARAFVYASTGSVYRPVPGGVNEDAATAPTNFYTASKLAAEDLLAPFAGHLALSIQRLFYVYGPNQSGMLTDGLAHRIRNGEAVSLQAPDGIRIAPMFSGDAARIGRLAIESGWSGVLNVGNPHQVTLRDYALMIGTCLGRPVDFAVTDGKPPLTVLPALDRLATLMDLGNLTPPEAGLTQTFG